MFAEVTRRRREVIATAAVVVAAAGWLGEGQVGWAHLARGLDDAGAEPAHPELLTGLYPDEGEPVAFVRLGDVALR